MSSTALYRAFIEAGASEERATLAAEDVVQVSQLPQLATKVDIADIRSAVADLRLATKSDIAGLEAATKSDIARLEAKMDQRETRLIKWMVGCMFLATGMAIAGAGLLVQIMLSPGVLR